MDNWENLYNECLSCQKCALCESRTNVVFGKGSKNAKILFIGEAPGAEEDKTGLPFVGRAGKLLDKFFAEVGLTLDDIYIANMLKCRPPDNRDPSESEQNSCIDYLRAQTKLLNPKIIICLGRISAMRVIKPDFKITQERGKWFKKGDYHLMAVYHPSALLRDPSKQKCTLDDFKEIVRMAGELNHEHQ